MPTSMRPCMRFLVAPYSVSSLASTFTSPCSMAPSPQFAMASSALAHFDSRQLRTHSQSMEPIPLMPKVGPCRPTQSLPSAILVDCHELVFATACSLFCGLFYFWCFIFFAVAQVCCPVLVFG